MTEPLTPPECDLTDFPFMPLDVARLRRSKAWLKAKRNPALAFYLINLWTASWHDRPAASLEDDDDVLADLAMCEPSKWPKVREEVLRGWMKCDDGRLYHPTVAEKAVEAWKAKLAQRARTEAARQAKEAKRQAEAQKLSQASQANPVTGSVAISVTETVTASKGEGQREGQGQGDSISSEANASAAAAAQAVDKSTKTPEELTKAELWEAGKSLLLNAGVPKGQCGTFVGKLVQDYGDQIVIEAVRSAVVTTPADPKEYLKATCMRLKGERKDAPAPLTVESKAAAHTAEMLRQQDAHNAAAVPPPAAVLERLNALKRGQETGVDA